MLKSENRFEILSFVILRALVVFIRIKVLRFKLRRGGGTVFCREAQIVEAENSDLLLSPGSHTP